MLHSVRQAPEYYVKDMPKTVPIAPAPEKKYGADLQDFRRYNCRSNPYTGSQAASIARRNARERTRVKQVNDGFNALRKRLPAAVVAALSGESRRGSGKKLSKVDTLRMVVEYIRHMENLIDESDAALGVTTTIPTTLYDVDEGVFAGDSPYSESVPSPIGSECSSGVSSAYSSNNLYRSQVGEEKFSQMDEDELLDAISWWQNK